MAASPAPLAIAAALSGVTPSLYMSLADRAIFAVPATGRPTLGYFMAPTNPAPSAACMVLSGWYPVDRILRKASSSCKPPMAPPKAPRPAEAPLLATLAMPPARWMFRSKAARRDSSLAAGAAVGNGEAGAAGAAGAEGTLGTANSGEVHGAGPTARGLFQTCGG